jgi:hypothetical protein
MNKRTKDLVVVPLSSQSSPALIDDTTMVSLDGKLLVLPPDWNLRGYLLCMLSCEHFGLFRGCTSFGLISLTLPAPPHLESSLVAQNKLIVLAALFAGASAFSPAAKPAFTTKLSGEKVNWDQAAELGWSMGGEDYTREVKPHADPDARKSIHDAPSFEEYMRMRQQQGN